MAVYKHHYRAYAGPLTPAWSRVLVVIRYAFAEAWSSKITVALFMLCLLPCIASLFEIYLANNPLARALLGNRGPGMLTIDAGFFLHYQQVHSWLALVLAAWIAPRLISFDLADNALPILLSHPLSRFTYLAGKFITLFASLSLVTWIPGLLLFAYQGYSASGNWAAGHLRIAAGLLDGAILWIAFLTLLGLALSAWVKWRMVATSIIVAAVFVPAGIGAIITGVLRTKWGFLLNIPFMMSSLWRRLLGAPEAIHALGSLSSTAIAVMLVLIAAVCMAMLHLRICAREVVRG